MYGMYGSGMCIHTQKCTDSGDTGSIIDPLPAHTHICEGYDVIGEYVTITITRWSNRLRKIFFSKIFLSLSINYIYNYSYIVAWKKVNFTAIVYLDYLNLKFAVIIILYINIILNTMYIIFCNIFFVNLTFIIIIIHII